MIARKITYEGDLNQEAAGLIFDISRKIEITGEVKKLNNKVELHLEGDPSMIKLIEHQVERRLKGQIKNKTVERNPFRFYQTLTFEL